MFYCYENEKKIEIKESLLSFPLNKTLKFNLAECSFSYMVTYLRQQIKVPSLQNPGWPPNTIQIWTCRILHDLLIHSPTRRLLGSLCTHKTESPWPLHYKHSHWWKRRSWSKFASYYAWETYGVGECKMNVKSTWIHPWHQMDHVLWSLGPFSNSTFGKAFNTKLVDHGTPNVHKRWIILFYHVRGPEWIETHWNIIWLRARSHMASHYMVL